MANISPITVARFWSKVSIPNYDSHCWEWQGSKNTDGYGNFRIPQFGRVTFGAHRVAYMLYNGDFPDEGLVVRHKCDNPSCVNPLHLEKGTVSDNVRDAVERGQWKPHDQKGEKNPAARLNAEQVLDIRRRLKRGEHYKKLAAEFAVCTDMIMRIQSRKSWAHLPDEDAAPHNRL